jgi:hypothetical protein
VVIVSHGADRLSVGGEWSTTELVMRNLGARSNPVSKLALVGFVLAGFLCAGSCLAQSGGSSNPPATATPDTKDQDKTPSDPTTTRLKIVVKNADDKPVGNASVYIRFSAAGSFLHKDRQAEMAFKTNDDGTVKVPDVPIGKILIQIVAKGLHTYGKWYDIVKDQDTIEIKLERPPKWY